MVWDVLREITAEVPLNRKLLDSGAYLYASDLSPVDFGDAGSVQGVKRGVSVEKMTCESLPWGRGGRAQGAATPVACRK